MASVAVFLDANVLVYSLDKTSEQHDESVKIIQRLLDEKADLCTSHHVIEEVLHIVQKIRQNVTTLSEVVEEINKMPDLTLIEPAANVDFAKRYAALSEQLSAGVNDALILQLMLDAGITKIFSYDKKLLKQAITLGIEPIT
ncbi:MAG TPA: type II toxin-antitoxin system VapC family toxin [Candidatus Dormibacteraeota bacterium]|nr:type II toxin-antitoxin system VapC family toxin [Candidatus Dormibacteraeota bacterium]